MNQRQKAFLPACIIVWTVTVLVAGLLGWAYFLAHSSGYHPMATIWMGTDLALIHLAAAAIWGVLSLEVLCRLTTGKSLW